MKKLFVSQPMNGVSKEEILRLRERAKSEAEDILEEPLELIDSYFEEDPTDSNIKSIPMYHLAKSIELLATADVAYFISGWKDSRGCNIEHSTAVEYDVLVIEEE